MSRTLLKLRIKRDSITELNYTLMLILWLYYDLIRNSKTDLLYK